MNVSCLLKSRCISVPVTALCLVLTACGSSEESSDASVGLTAKTNHEKQREVDSLTGHASIIDGTDTGSITKDDDRDADNLLEVQGRLRISDRDKGEAMFMSEVINGTYGDLVMGMLGHWYYSADNRQDAIQGLSSSEKLNDILTVTSVDGTRHTITITINGVTETNTDKVIFDTAPGTLPNTTPAPTPDPTPAPTPDPTPAPTPAPTPDTAAHNAARANSYDDTWESQWVANVKNILSASVGVSKSAGKVLQVGDSMTYSYAYGDLARHKTGLSASDLETVNWMHAGTFGTEDGWKFSSTGVTAMHNANWGSGFIDQIFVDQGLNDAQFAVIMFNVNNIAYVETRINEFIAAGIVPVLSTIPPRTDLSYNQNKAEPYNEELRALAKRLGLPIIDYSKEMLLRRPNGSWENTLISADGVHPSGGVNGYSPISDPYANGGDAATHTTGAAALNSGYLLRTWLTIQKMKEIKQKAVDTGDSAGDNSSSGDTGNSGSNGSGSGDTSGSNNAAVISGVDSGNVTEDNDPDADSMLEVAGKLNISDSDVGEAAFVAATSHGNFGSLTINATGYWSYAADNTQSLVQNLASGEVVTDILTVSSLDGTTHTVVISINGVDEPSQGGGSGSDSGNFLTPPLSCSQPNSTCYDIIYVRYPLAGTTDVPAPAGQVALPAGETPYTLESGGDLMLLRKDGSEKVLVDCNTCTVMDPFISYDGKTVYYSYNEKVMTNPYGDEFASWIYKIHLEGHPKFDNHKPIRLTFNDGFDSVQYKANRGADGNIKTADHDQGRYRAIRDMAPIQLADGRLLFTSNRSALTAFHPRTNAIITGSVQQMYVMDDHDGSANTRELANIQRLETGNIHMVQHPIQLKDGRILFSTWQDMGMKMNKLQYASTSLFTVNPDGSNLQQFTEPHDHHKNVEHFVSQLSDEQVVWTQYYPMLEGFGIIMRAPVSTAGPEFMRDSISQRHTAGNQYKVSYREYDRVGTVTLTPHTHGGDSPAYDASGKYSMPSAVNDGGLLVAYSTGTVNQTKFACEPSGQCESLRSGIYLIPNADGDASSFVTNPVNQLIKIKDDPHYNEIWPRAVLSYGEIHGISKPDLVKDLATSQPDDYRLRAGEASSLLGTSSIYNREPLNEADPDPFLSSTSREFTDGNWTVQGAEAGVFTNKDIYGVRIIATPPKPYTRPIKKNQDLAAWNQVSRYLQDERLNEVVARYGSAHGERWEILGEFPVKKSVVDNQGNPDTSWLAKIPADTPTFIQTIDKNGMTLVSELTWRALKSGEKRADCGGCHAHSVEPLDFATTEAGKGRPITNVAGVSSTDPEVKDGVWDLTLNKIPLLNNAGVTFEPGYSYGVEFNRDIKPILNNRCVSCHTAGQPAGAKLVLDSDPWSRLSETGDYANNMVQVSRYIRAPQARQSLLVWATWGERLDGRTNAERGDDIDFNGHPSIPGITDKEKRTIARWVDLGSPIDFPNDDGLGYTDDYQLPVVNIYTPQLGNNSGAQLKVGFNDAKSGLNWNSLQVRYYKVGAAPQTLAINVGSDVDARNILTKSLPIGNGDYVVTVSINDAAGNTGVATRRFTIN